MALGAGLLAAAATVSLYAAFALRIDPAIASIIGPDRPPIRSVLARMLPRIADLPAVRRIARPGRLEGVLASAGSSMSVRDVIVTKVGLAGSVGLVSILVVPTMLPLALVAAAGAFAAPDFVLARAGKARVRRADRAIPEFLDLLSAASSAGLAAPSAIRRASTGVEGPLAEELEAAAAAVELGARWRDELQAIADRMRLPDLQAAVTMIARTESLGSSLAESLRQLADDVRESRRSRATERARTAPVKMLFPLVFMILPAFLLLTVVPVLIATLRSLR